MDKASHKSELSVLSVTGYSEGRAMWVYHQCESDQEADLEAVFDSDSSVHSLSFFTSRQLVRPGLYHLDDDHFIAIQQSQ